MSPIESFKKSAETLQQLQRVRAAASELRRLKRGAKDQVLFVLANQIDQQKENILQANAKDLADLSPDANAAFRDRLMLNEVRLCLMQESLRQIASQPDPVGEVVAERVLANGLQLQKVSAPLGVIFMIFESRPNVVTEAFSLGFKAGNAMILRGGRESQNTSRVLFSIIQTALQQCGVPQSALWGITDSDRDLVQFLLKQKRDIDIVVPRGGDALIEYVTRESLIPIIKNDRGMCHIYAHADVDLNMAVEIIVNAKTQRPGVCNSTETVLIHQDVADDLLPILHKRMRQSKMIWYGCPKTLHILGEGPDVQAAQESNWDTEYLDYKINSRIVTSFDEAIAHIEAHGSRHSEAILTKDAELAKEFQECVDAAAVYWNASTRFTDGFEFGLGGELGISTQKLHVRGPVGLRELTSTRWIGNGTGQIRK